MRAKEFIIENTVKKLGRTFNHLEDLVFFYGSQGTIEALEHIREMLSDQLSPSIRVKWDGNPQIYWGREIKNGPLILSGHNGWSRGVKTDNPKDLARFIAYGSGDPKTDAEKKARIAFAKQFAGLYDIFDQSTPLDFVGFVYGDALFLSKPQIDAEGNYTFCPNPKSETCYHVNPKSNLGKQISNAQIMVVGHAYYPKFGLDDSEQQPVDDFSQFNQNASLIVQGPVYVTNPTKFDTKKIDEVEQDLASSSRLIDSFLQETPGLGDLKNILYTYVNQTAKSKQLGNLGTQSFLSWLKSSKVSTPKQGKIEQKLSENQGALDAIFNLVTKIMTLKDQIIDQVENQRGEIWATNGEGYVRYGAGKQFGNVKLVPRKRWTPK